ncbi:MAG: DUF4911 domain-containing protein [Deltaproteobacteria bacterium]|nr:DUF4911 domain-containing protein [Deltaproteobacteria bacterium]
MTGSESTFITRIIRVHRRDAAFVYAILESLDGMTSFTTLPDAPGQDYRELELHVAPGFAADLETVLNGLRKKFPVLEIPPGES